MSEELRTAPSLKGFLKKHLDKITEVTAGVVPERMKVLVCMAAAKDKRLAECTPMSILGAMGQAAELGLEVCSGKNEGYLIPRYNGKAKLMEATFLPGYQGLIKLARESGAVRNIEARVVYASDHFEVEEGTAPRIIHRPSFLQERGGILAFYAVAFLPDGGTQFEVMADHEIRAIMDRAKDGKDGFSPWESDYAEMGRKTVVRRLAKYLPKSAKFAKALEIQARSEAGEYDVTSEIGRPGDVPTLDAPKTVVNEDGDLEVVWTDSDKETAKQSCADLADVLIAAGKTEAEAGEIMADRWQTIGSPDLTPERWTNRFLSFAAAHQPKSK